MPQTIAIPGRRVSSGETFRTDWVPRGGDCTLLRVEVLIANGGGDEVSFSLETRGEDGATVTTMAPTSPSGGLELTATGVATALYLATTSTTPGNGAQEQVRVVVAVSDEIGTGYYVVRILPLIFFDSAKSY
jgi:hypothetical protein